MIPLLLALSIDAALPPVSDLQRFPPLEAANDAVGFHIRRHYELWLKLQFEPHNARHWQAALDAHAPVPEAWQWLVEAQGGCDEEEDYQAGPLARRVALLRLREVLGEADYWRGRMP